MDFLQKKISQALIKFLTTETKPIYHNPTHTYQKLLACIRPGDVLLVEGRQRFSAAIKYLTQSNWSHSAIYVGDEKLIEADLDGGVIEIPLNTYEKFHTRICRPVNLSDQDSKKVIDYVKSKIGHQYDLKNIIDLARYLLPTPPVPDRYKRDVLEFGSGDPTKVICSSMIADAFQMVHYPILPLVERKDGKVLFKRKKHHTLFTPADFDRSPYFNIVKPTIEGGFNYKEIIWENFDQKSPYQK